MALNYYIERDCYRNGELADAVIYSICKALSDECGWLNYIFGKADRITNVQNGRKSVIPAYYWQNGEYVNLCPDDISGNYCFFTLDDPQSTELSKSQSNVLYRTPFSLIVWVDWRTVYEEKDSEALKNDLLTILNRKGICKNGSFTINRIYERAENVWSGFTIDETKNQCMMSPFGGFRFSGELTVRTSCNEII